jgi:phage baseplate assembly protein gpV
MPNVQKLSAIGEQKIMLCPTGTTYSGYISGVMYSNYSVTPDVIYARYQSGPYFSSSFLDYLVDKLGIRITYTDAAGETTPWNLLKEIGLE